MQLRVPLLVQIYRRESARCDAATDPIRHPRRSPTGPRGPSTKRQLLMIPFPIVRIAGRLLPRGAWVRLLVVTAPRGAVVTARCRGTGCPLRPLRRRSHGQPVRIRGLERRLAARTRLEILVRQRGLVGKYTRFRIRAGGRSPLRDDRCLLPGRRTPVSIDVHPAREPPRAFRVSSNWNFVRSGGASTGQMHRRRKGCQVTARGIHHVDLAVTDVDAWLAFYLDLLEPLGLAEEVRYPTYRGTGGRLPG